MGRWSARLAPLFLDFCDIDFCDVGGARRLLDVGCGTGVLSEVLVRRWPAVEVVGIDPAEDYIAYARRRVGGTAATFHVGDALALPGPEAAFDGAFALLILQEFSEPENLVREMTRMTSAGGIVATCQWDFADGMPMLMHFWDAVAAVHPGGDTERETKRRVPKGRTTEESLGDLWRQCGLQDSATTTIDVVQDFANFEDYWRPFLSGATPTSTYAAGLPPAVQEAIKAELRERLSGGDADRPFTLTARALAVRGRVPRT
jgi:SAM-dependent methyltransferase